MSAPGAACDLSICTVGLHHRRELAACLASIFAHPPARHSFEVVLVDNASTDGTAELVEREYPAVRLVRNPVRWNFSRNYNLAMRHARGRYLLVLNPDTEVRAGTLDAMLDFMDARPDVGIATCTLRYPDGRFQENCRRFPRLRYVLASRLHALGLVGRTRYLEEYVMVRPDDREPKPVDYVLGAFMVIRRQALETTGGFDERFPLYAEDTDLCYRMWQRGWAVYYVPGPEAVHAYARAGARRIVSAAALKQVYTLLLFWAKNRAPVF